MTPGFTSYDSSDTRDTPRGITPLIDAATAGDMTSMRRLISQGVNLDETDNEGRTALMWAAARGNLDCLTLLTNAGANIEARNDDGKTALMYAAETGWGVCTETLIKAGADVTAKDKGGRTAEAWATLRGHGHIMEIFRGTPQALDRLAHEGVNYDRTSAPMPVIKKKPFAPKS